MRIPGVVGETLDEYAYAGTTLAMAKKGAGLKDILDPCIEALIETEQYYEICEKWSLADSCFQTEYFPDRRNRARRLADLPYNDPTSSQTDGCGDGYCSCDAGDA